MPLFRVEPELCFRGPRKTSSPEQGEEKPVVGQPSPNKSRAPNQDRTQETRVNVPAQFGEVFLEHVQTRIHEIRAGQARGVIQVFAYELLNRRAERLAESSRSTVAYDDRAAQRGEPR